jgi:prepilin-type N-terminal cleavage/methylation domain-containing protein
MMGNGGLRAGGGFTLVELLVSIGLFSVITSIAVGGFVSVLRSERQAAGLLAANSNVSLSIEQMAREMRTGYNFCTARNCLLSELNFRNARGDEVTYRLQNGAIERQVNAGAFQKITADNVEVKYLKFYLQGREAGDGEQPRITIVVGVSSKEPGVAGNVSNLQTTVSARLPLDT